MATPMHKSAALIDAEQAASDAYMAINRQNAIINNLQRKIFESAHAMEEQAKLHTILQRKLDQYESEVTNMERAYEAATADAVAMRTTEPRRAEAERIEAEIRKLTQKLATVNGCR